MTRTRGVDSRLAALAALSVTVAACVTAGPACGRKTDVRPPELVAPKSVSQLALTSTADGVQLRWTRPTQTVDGKAMEDLGGFIIERAVSAVGFREIARVPVTDQGRYQKEKRFEYLDRDVVPGATFHYRVIAFTTDGYNSAPSGAATVTWATPAPSASPDEPSPSTSPRHSKAR
jgi:hypothetical protein